MTILQAVASYSGRMSRSAYWRKGVLPLVLCSVVVCAIPLLAMTKGMVEGAALFLYTWMWAGMLWFRLPADVKRCHDRNRSAWYLLFYLIPVIGTIWYVVEIWCLPGKRGPNRFGEDPRQTDGPSPVAERTPVQQKDLVVAFTNGLLVLSLAFILGTLIPFAREVFFDVGKAPPIGMTLLVWLLNHYLFLSPIAAFTLWLGARLASNPGPRKRSAMLCIIGATLLIHVAAAAVYIPAIRMYRTYDLGANQPSEGTR